MPFPTQDFRAEAEKVAKLRAFYASLRAPTEAESRLIMEAMASGATLVPSYWREYFSGANDALPVQWEGVRVLVEDLGDPGIEQAAESLRASRDAFLARVTGGDLRPVAEAVRAERAAASQARAA